MKHEDAEATLNKMGFTVAVNEFQRWVAVRGPRKVFGRNAAEILDYIRADYRPGREN